MPFTWQMPYQPPDPAALERMRQHFHQPDELMPEAWFISGDVDYLTGFSTTDLATFSDEALAETLAHALHEIWTGIAYFPEVLFVSAWRAWFKYLLPYTLPLIQTPYKHSGIYDLFEGTFNAFANVYPQQIIEEYAGFRNDVVYALGTRVIPKLLSRDYPSSSTELRNPLYNDIWYRIDDDVEAICRYDVFDYPMRFCLKYLFPTEIETWVESLLNIDSPQWRLAVITWWSLMYPEVVADISMPPQNLEAFMHAMRRHLTYERFVDWAEDIQSYRTFRYDDEILPISSTDIELIASALRQFEVAFFAKG